MLFNTTFVRKEGLNKACLPESNK